MDGSTTQISRMFIDYLSVEQVYPFDLPKVADITIDRYCARTGELLSTTQPSWKHEGSYSTSITIRVDGRKLIVQGNPSAVDRLDNLFGYETIEQCVSVYNRILAEYGLPGLTRCTRIDYMQAPSSRTIRRLCKVAADDLIKAAESDAEGDANAWIRTVESTHRHTPVGDGMRITRIDLTTNRTVGKGNVLQYLRALSTQRAGYKLAKLYEDGNTVDWLARDQYRKAYNKAVAITKFLLPKARKNFGDDSPEVAYLKDLTAYCDDQGVVRMEQELKREYLLREGLAFWGLFDESRFKAIHEAFLTIDQKLTVTAMDFETISQHLVSQGVVDNTKAANTTAQYAYAWMHGQRFDLNKRAVQTARARLRKIGIDIANPCDVTRFRPVVTTREEAIQTADLLVMPSWYRRPVGHLQLVAA